MFRFTSLFLSFFLLMCIAASAQDLLVSVDGDSLNCKVLKKNERAILFSYTEDNETITRELSADLFKSVIQGYFQENQTKPGTDSTAQAIPVNKIVLTTTDVDSLASLAAANRSTPPTAATQPVSKPTESPKVEATAPEPVFGSGKWYGGIRAGYANRLFRMGVKYTPELRDYFTELKSGYGGGLSAGYKFAKFVGIGINGDLYRSVARMRDGSRDDVVSIRYIGPEVMYRKPTARGNSVVFAGFTTGYQVFRQSGQEAGTEFSVKGRGMGWGANAGMDFKISPNAAISLSASALLGALYKYDKTVGKKTETIHLGEESFEDLSRIALTIGLRFL